MRYFPTPADAPDPLQRLLLEAVPANDHGRKTTNHLADLLGVRRWTVRKWIIGQKLPPHRALEVVALAEGRVTKEDFDPFVYKR